MRVSTPPRLSASAISRTTSARDAAASSDPVSNASMPPNPRIWRLASSYCGMRREARIVDVPDLRVAAPGTRASAMPLALCCAIRTGSVLVPRSTSHESNGDRIAPAAFWTNLQPLDVVVARRDDDAADAVAVAVQVLRGAVRDEVGAELDRALQARAGKGVVDDEPQAASVRQIRGGAQIGEPHHRVAGRFDEQHPRGGGNGPLHLRRDRRCRRA